MRSASTNHCSPGGKRKQYSAMLFSDSINFPMLQLISFAFGYTFVLFFSLMLVMFWRKSKSLIHKLPPGPTRLPLIGNLHQIGSLPHHSLTNLARKYGPVMRLQLGEVSAVIVSSPKAIEELLKTNDLSFAQRPSTLGTQILEYDNDGLIFAPYGDNWRQLRKICTLELLNAKRVQSRGSIREDEVGNLIQVISSREGVPVNLSKYFSAMANNVASRAALGEECKDRDEFMSLLSEAMVLSGGFKLPDFYPSIRFLLYITGMQPALRRIQKMLDKILAGIINEHRKRKYAPYNDQSNRQSLLDVLLDLRESNQPEVHLTTDQIKILIMEIIFAASDTTASTMAWAMSELVKNPETMEKAQAEVRQAFKGKPKIEESEIQGLHYLKSVIKETLRLHPAIAIGARNPREKCEIGGYQIPMTTKVYINIWGFGRDPNIWTEPESFKPERFEDSPVDYKGANFDMISFGGGRRMCPGISFAAAGIELALAHMLYHFDWKLPNGSRPEELDMSELFGISVRRKHDLCLIATARFPFGNRDIRNN